VTSQQRAAASAADPGIQQRSGNSEQMEESVASSAGRVANIGSPVTLTGARSLTNQRDDDVREENDEEPVSAVRDADKRKLEEDSSRTSRRQVTSSVSSALRAHVESMIDTVRPHLLTLVDDTDNVALWLTLLLPKNDEGNNFGVEVQNWALEFVKSASV